MRAQSDAPLRQIEPEREPHRPAEPGIRIAFGRPCTFNEAAEHNAIVVGETRLKRAKNAYRSAGLRVLPHDPSRQKRGEQFHVVGLRDRQPCGGAADRELVKRVRDFLSVGTAECGFAAVVFRKRGKHRAMARGKFRQRLAPVIHFFERGECRSEPPH